MKGINRTSSANAALPGESAMTSAMPPAIRELRDQGSLRDVDLYFADLVRRMSGKDEEPLLIAAALVSRFVGEGHICLDLRETAALRRYPNLDVAAGRAPETDRPLQVDLPAFDAWCAALRKADSCVGKPGERKPLILDNAGRLYLHRYWQYESFVAAKLKEMAAARPDPEFPANFGHLLATLFDAPVSMGGDRQRLAAFAALRNRLLIITGGPGTGKTYTAVQILALLTMTNPGAGEGGLRVKLAAPTGKAAMRLVESIRGAKKQDSPIPDARRADIPEEAATLHRLLGVIPGSPYFRHNAENPLDADVVIVDEASMIDLPMMAKLLMALAPRTRLILLGDMNQLASVEPGYVLGDICRAADLDAFSASMRDDYRSHTKLDIADAGTRWDGPTGIGDCLLRLSCSRRFPPDGPIGRLSAAVNDAASGHDADAAWPMLRELPEGDITCRDCPERLTDASGRPLKQLRHRIADGYADFLNADTPRQAFEALKRFRILCATRQGPHGVNALNRLVEAILSFEHVRAKPTQRKRRLNPGGEFYDHRVVMITRNDYSLGLFNGDIGVILQPRDGQGPRLVAFFEEASENGEPGYREIPPNMLPEHETAFAITIHKSQGSEFGSLLIILPPRDTRLLTKELLYTAITRVKRDDEHPESTGQVELWCSEAAFKAAVLRRTERSSGLRDALQAE